MGTPRWPRKLVGLNLRTYRKGLGLSVYDLAERAHVSTATVRRIESGAARYPSIETILWLAWGVRVGVELLFLDDDWLRSQIAELLEEGSLQITGGCEVPFYLVRSALTPPRAGA